MRAQGLFRSILLAGLLTALVTLGIGYRRYQSVMQQPLSPEEESVLVLPKGATLSQLAEKLHARYALEAIWPVKLYARLDPSTTAIKAGEYRIDRNSTFTSLIADMHAGRVIVHSLRFVAGKRFADLIRQLDETPDITHKLTGKTRAEIAYAVGIDGDPEGWFLPQTYHYTRGSSDLELLKRLYSAMRDTLDSAWQNRGGDLPLKSPYQALILASIIEKETGIANERARIAGVFIRRLENGMRLQTDPTVRYGLNTARKTLTHSDLSTDTPYNTYTRMGLPPTPIAMPGKAAIEAALHPQRGNALYFVANGKGGHTFSATYAEHQKAVRAYRRLRNTSP